MSNPLGRNANQGLERYPGGTTLPMPFIAVLAAGWGLISPLASAPKSGRDARGRMEVPRELPSVMIDSPCGESTPKN